MSAPTSLDLISEVMPRAFFSRDFICALLLAIFLTPVVMLVARSERAMIARESINLAAPILLGILAVTVASLALYSSLASKEFIEKFRGHSFIIRTFFWTISVVVIALCYSFILFLLTWIPSFVESLWFVGAGMLGLAIFFYAAFLTFGVAYTVTMQMLALERIRK